MLAQHHCPPRLVDPQEAPAGGEPQVLAADEQLGDEQGLLGLVDEVQHGLDGGQLVLVGPERGGRGAQSRQEVERGLLGVTEVLPQGDGAAQ